MVCGLVGKVTAKDVVDNFFHRTLYTDREPSLQRLLELCFRNGLPVLDICRGNGSIIASTPGLRKSDAHRAWRFQAITEMQKTELREKLTTLSVCEFAPCLKDAASALGVAVGTLKTLAPEACENLSK